MRSIVVFGASSGLGATLIEHFCRQGKEVIAVARHPEKNARLLTLGVQIVQCDATKHEEINKVVASLPKNSLVVSTMGSARTSSPVDYIGHRNLVDALEKHSILRFLLVTSLGCGDSWLYLSEAARKGFGSIVREKSLAETWLTTSSLKYTIVRPGGLKDGEVTHSAQLTQNEEVHGLISRQELARVISSLLESERSIGQVYACVDPSLTYQSGRVG
ncbi:flavin reductase [Vibrio variabilis]|uniref:Flavin reductase n=1 Tax=Vibrio variabilis TaxID=990271 RepID=A0ABR4YBA8_9VIBR|nr:SDR family NAD(P)-dependent oxidoreductase [Vibrio variabilis]KHA60768.1 flavin reductase [Vibrio variabilis]